MKYHARRKAWWNRSRHTFSFCFQANQANSVWNTLKLTKKNRSHFPRHNPKRRRFLIESSADGRNPLATSPKPIGRSFLTLRPGASYVLCLRRFQAMLLSKIVPSYCSVLMCVREYEQCSESFRRKVKAK